MNKLKKILIIVYYFPPRGGTAVVRTMKFVKYLREFGWEPIVLTVDHNYFAFKDENLLKEIPGATIIYKTRQPWIQSLVRNWQHRLQRKKRSEQKFKKLSDSNKRNKIYLTVKTIKNYINKFIFCPDDYAGWKRLAMKKIKKILKEHKIDIVYTTSPPHSVQLIGLAVSKKYAIPWVADFRDPWTQDFRYFHPATIFHRNKIEKAESNIVAQAARVISVSDAMSNYFKKKYKKIDSSKFITIMNGFDSQNFSVDDTRTKNKDKFVIIYAGSFYMHRTPIWFYNAVKKFLDKNPSAYNDLLIQTVGKSQKNYETYPAKIGIDGNVEHVGHVPHEQVSHYLFNSDILLLVLWSNPNEYDYAFSGKFFEYLAVRKPIFATLNQGACADFIHEHKLGVVVPFDNETKICEGLTSVYQQWKNNQFDFEALDNENLAQFERKNLTKKLAGVLDLTIKIKSKS